MSSKPNSSSYWRTNIAIVSLLLLIWFVVGYGMGILFIEELNQIKFGKLGLGFWTAQQGAIFVFILLVLVYAVSMDWVDRKHGVSE